MPMLSSGSSAWKAGQRQRERIERGERRTEEKERIRSTGRRSSTRMRPQRVHRNPRPLREDGYESEDERALASRPPLLRPGRPSVHSQG